MHGWPEIPENPQLLEAVLRRFDKDFPAVIDCRKGWHQLVVALLECRSLTQFLSMTLLEPASLRQQWIVPLLM